MANPRKQPGDAVVSRDGTVKLNKKHVGFWWRDGNDLYHFARERPQNEVSSWGAISSPFLSQFKSDVGELLRSEP